MTNHIVKFNLDTYASLLDVARENDYKFVLFDKRNQCTDNTCIIRHDIDANVSAAHVMAKIEHERDIKTTYCVMIRSPLYNIFSRHDSRYLEKILEMGHEIGLHYDAAFHKKCEFSLSQSISEEISILETMFDTCVDVVSFHQPDAMILKGNLSIPYKVNTYNKTDMSGYMYISDSNMRFSHENPFDVLNSGTYNRLHLLIHPLWWIYGDNHIPEDVWDIAIKCNFELSQQQLLETEVVYGNPRTMSLQRSDIT